MRINIGANLEVAFEGPALAEARVAPFTRSRSHRRTFFFDFSLFVALLALSRL